MPHTLPSFSKWLAAGLTALIFAGSALAHAGSAPAITIIAAENFYGAVASILGGSHVTVTSILNNPEQDPHLFEASPKTARDLRNANLVIYNGADYDPWMEKLLATTHSAQRTTIVAAQLIGKQPGDNPHLWYNPATMPAVANAIVAALKAIDPSNSAEYSKNLDRFRASLQPLNSKITALRARYRGTPVIATEPVFGYMADALGLNMQSQRLQRAIMNGTEPSAMDIAAFERNLRDKRVRVLIYNRQAQTPMTQRMLDIARTAGIPTVSVTETLPLRTTYQQWMLTQIDALANALAADPQP